MNAAAKARGLRAVEVDHFAALLEASPLGSAESRRLQASVSEERAREVIVAAGERALEEELLEHKDSVRHTRTPIRTRYGSHVRHWRMALLALDLVIGVAATSIAILLSSTATLAAGLVGGPLWVTLLLLNHAYDRRALESRRDEVRALAGATLAAVILTPALSLFSSSAVPLDLLLTGLVGISFATLGSGLLRGVRRRIIRSQRAQGIGLKNAAVVGPEDAVRRLCDRLEVGTSGNGTSGNWRVAGAFLALHERADSVTSREAALYRRWLPESRKRGMPDNQWSANLGIPMLGTARDVTAEMVRHLDIDSILIAPGGQPELIQKVNWSLDGSGVEFLVDTGVEAYPHRLQVRHQGPLTALSIKEPSWRGWTRGAKRLLDITLTVPALTVLSPVLVAIAIAVKWQDGGPVLFRQKRVGQNGTEFWMYKFRSMTVDAEAGEASLRSKNAGEGGLFKIHKDPRITPLGEFLRKYSLDELPQLFNVVNGTMSLVGPRPYRACEISQMPQDSWRRFLVPAGLTGLRQVSEQGQFDENEGIRLDLEYVDNWTIRGDLAILVQTIPAVFRRGLSRDPSRASSCSSS